MKCDYFATSTTVSQAQASFIPQIFSLFTPCVPQHIMPNQLASPSPHHPQTCSVRLECPTDSSRQRERIPTLKPGQFERVCGQVGHLPLVTAWRGASWCRLIVGRRCRWLKPGVLVTALLLCLCCVVHLVCSVCTSMSFCGVIKVGILYYLLLHFFFSTGVSSSRSAAVLGATVSRRERAVQVCWVQ